MARTALTVQDIVQAGVAATYASANADGNSVPCDGSHWIEVVNGAGAPVTVTVPTPGTIDGLAVADLTVTVTNGTTKKIRIPPSRVTAQTDGTAHIDYSSATSITVAAFRLA